MDLAGLGRRRPQASAGTTPPPRPEFRAIFRLAQLYGSPWGRPETPLIVDSLAHPWPPSPGSFKAGTPRAALAGVMSSGRASTSGSGVASRARTSRATAQGRSSPDRSGFGTGPQFAWSLRCLGASRAATRTPPRPRRPVDSVLSAQDSPGARRSTIGPDHAGASP